MSARRCPAPGHGKRSCPSSYFVNARVCDFAARHSKDPLGAHAGQTLTYHRAYIVDISPYLKVVANQPYGSRRPVEQIALRLSTCYPRCLQSMF
jgi:hypothetical protein